MKSEVGERPRKAAKAVNHAGHAAKKQKEGQKHEKGYLFAVRSSFRFDDGVFAVDFGIGTGKNNETQNFDDMAAATPLLANVWRVGKGH